MTDVWLQAQSPQKMMYLFWCTVYVMFYADWLMYIFFNETNVNIFPK